jgi:hypothetical protein
MKINSGFLAIKMSVYRADFQSFTKRIKMAKKQFIYNFSGWNTLNDPEDLA